MKIHLYFDEDAMDDDAIDGREEERPRGWD
jgi:hypothetical protein